MFSGTNSVQEERLEFLLSYLVAEQKEKIIMPKGFHNQWALLRAFVNIRPPGAASEPFIQVQNDFLQEESRQKGIVDWKSLQPCRRNGHIYLWQGDITRLNTDAIVNAANNQMLGCFYPGHHCIDNAIHTAAGIQLRNECKQMMDAQGHDEKTGRAKITGAYNLPCKYVIHTVGPIVGSSVSKLHREQLQDSYRYCLNKAKETEGVRSIAFCCISTGEYRFPNQEAASIAVATVIEWLHNVGQGALDVVFNVFKDSDYQEYYKLLDQ